MRIGGGRHCEEELCNHYSDIDVYYEDGTIKDLCSMHAQDACDSTTGKKVIQAVPQHGGDMNQEIKES